MANYENLTKKQAFKFCLIVKFNYFYWIKLLTISSLQYISGWKNDYVQRILAFNTLFITYENKP